MTYDEYRQWWDNATPTEREGVRAKCRWEHMSPWAVLNEWGTDGWAEYMRSSSAPATYF